MAENNDFNIEVYKGNMVIQKLQAKIGQLSGDLAIAEAERDMYLSVIKDQKQKEEKPKEKEKEKPKTKKKKGE